MSYFGPRAMGATNFSYNYSLLSNGCCYDSVAKKCVDAKAYCAGDLAAATKASARYQMVESFCTDTTTGKRVDYALCNPTKASSPSTFDKILSGISILGRPQPGMMPQSSVPNWLLPVGLAAAGLGVVLILTKPKKTTSSSAPAATPTSNPARRRRRRR